ncbi:MAG: hypothetical protein ABEH43_05420 [Flavobacteriales bacterium]
MMKRTIVALLCLLVIGCAESGPLMGPAGEAFDVDASPVRVKKGAPIEAYFKNVEDGMTVNEVVIWSYNPKKSETIGNKVYKGYCKNKGQKASSTTKKMFSRSHKGKKIFLYKVNFDCN